jgi:hypothetical protein
MTTKRHAEIVRVIAERTRVGVPPQTQNECARLAACVCLRLDPKPLPWSDEHIIETAVDMAAGIFGASFKRATTGRR